MDSSSRSLLFSMCRAKVSRQPEKRGRVCGCSGFVVPRAAIKPPNSATIFGIMGDRLEEAKLLRLSSQSEALEEKTPQRECDVENRG